MATVPAHYPRTAFEGAPFELPVDDELTLRQATPGDLPEICRVIRANLEHLASFFTLETTAAGEIDTAQQANAYYDGRTVDYMVRRDGRLAGIVGLHDRHAQVTKMGYWVVQDMQGRGIITRSASRIRDFAFDEFDISKIVLDIRQDNTPSKRVALRLGAWPLPLDDIPPGCEQWLIDKDRYGQT